jgi:asparagine synthase (glutamine-hydrolysing)
MCGIFGVWLRDGSALDPAAVRRGVESLAHRGPDDEGYAFISLATRGAADFAGASSPAAVRASYPSIDGACDSGVVRGANVALGHRRFAIISPVPEGHQPFWNDERTVCLSFNGEIYNYIELRGELTRAGHHFRTATDTEVLLRAYLAWGESCFERLNGMWAVAIVDLRSGELVLCRDRCGERPLYVQRAGGGLHFASEIRALLAARAATPAANAASILRYLNPATNRLASEETFFEGITSIPPATVVRIDGDGVERRRVYWRLPPRVESESHAGRVGDLCEELRELLTDAVAIRLRADVPVNAALSGGMDSSTVVAFAARALGDQLRTYTVRFRERAWNEYPYARRVIDHCGVQSLVLDPPAEWVDRFLPEFVVAMEEPFHAPDLLTDYVVRRVLAARGIRVSLSGIGGDEIFAGYELYRWLYARELASRGAWGGWARELLLSSEGAPLRALPGALLARARGRQRRPAAGAAVRAGIVGLDATRFATPPTDASDRLSADFTRWLLPYWLRVGDKASMAIPIEVRYPLLDHRIAEFGFRLPVSYLVRNGWLKWILRKAVSPMLPRGVVWRRRKMGYPFPIREWMRSRVPEMRELFATMDNPFLDRRFWTRELEPAIEASPYEVWHAFSLELWHRRFIRESAVAPPRLVEPLTGVA